MVSQKQKNLTFAVLIKNLTHMYCWKFYNNIKWISYAVSTSGSWDIYPKTSGLHRWVLHNLGYWPILDWFSKYVSIHTAKTLNN